MSDNRNSGSLLYPYFSFFGGVASYGTGLGILTAYPAANGRYVPYFGSDNRRVNLSGAVEAGRIPI